MSSTVMKKPDTTLTKADTVALWNAIQWMIASLSNWRDQGFADERDKELYAHQCELLTTAKHALCKANAIRKAQTEARRAAPMNSKPQGVE